MKKTWRILSIDGGGIRGIIPALLLTELERRTGHQICELFDFIAGTSTGSILALGLTKSGCNGTAQYRAKDLLHLYECEGPSIFETDANKTSLQRISNTILSSILGGPRYKNDGIEKALLKYFADARLKDALTPVLIPSVHFNEQMSFFFKSWDQRDGEQLIRNVARASSAAPTYFSPWVDTQSQEPEIYLDGGIAANNPTACALSEARRYVHAGDDFFVVSLGTGLSQVIRPVDWKKVMGWRNIQWLEPTMLLFFSAHAQVVHYQVEQELFLESSTRQYYRFNTKLNPGADLIDNASKNNMTRLRQAARRIIEVEQTDEFNAIVEQLLALLAQQKCQRQAVIGVNRIR